MNKKEDTYRICATIAFIVVIVIIGVPMWWKTTTVHRVNLPSSNIMALSKKPIRTEVNIAIFTFASNRAQLLIDELNSQFQDNEYWSLNFVAIEPFKKASEVRTPAMLEALLLKEHTQAVGDFLFIEWPKLKEEVLLTTERSALIRSDTTASKLALVLNTSILQTHRIKQILSKDELYGTKVAPSQPEYDVVISILNPRPDIMLAKWNVRMAVDIYVKPFLREVSAVSNYTVKTQWKYNLPIEAELKQIIDKTPLGRHYAVQVTEMPHIITSIEKNLGSSVTSKPSIHVVIYIPPCEVAPIHVYRDDNDINTRYNLDAFVSPNWGSFVFANPPEEACRAYNENEDPVQFYLETNEIMQIVVYQLQQILDISCEITIDGVESVALEQFTPRVWEYEAYIRRSAIMHIATATNTLQNLIKLLDDISYIVINDDVGNEIIDSFYSIEYAKAALANGELLNATAHAKRAFVTSEKVFFDSSLLAQLYFPDEQKYAIYIPLFLPIMVPVITSFSTLRKLLFKSKKKKNKSTEQTKEKTN